MKKMISRRNFLKAAGVSAAALGLAACGGSSSSTAASTATSTAASSTAAASGASGKVYYLNFKPEQDQDWQDLAAEYTKETGVPVTVVTAASGQYETTLMSEMEKSEAPTLFQVNGPVGLANWKDYCLDLSDSKLYGELTSDSFALKDGDAVTSIAYVIETYGIIYNKELLSAAGYTQDDIKGFDDLKKVADDIQARKAELGVDGAFTSAGMDSSSDWRFKTHLANLPIYYEYKADGIGSTDAIKGTYLDNFKNVWDLYTTDSATTGAALTTATGDASEAEFGQGKAVFYQNGSWEFANLTGEEKGFKMNPEDLAMIPIYCGVEGEEKSGLCCGTENCWAVNKNAKEEDIQATLDFMKWVVTSDEGTTMLAEQFGPCPFKNAKTPENVFFADANAYTTAGNYIVTWAFNWTPAVDDWRAGVVDALTQYTVNGGSWDNVKTAFVDGWATQYAKENG